MLEFTMPALTGLVLLLLLWNVRRRTADKLTRQRHHLAAAEQLLKAQAQAMNHFLKSNAPESAKASLMSYSEALDDRAFVAEIANLICLSEMDASGDTDSGVSPMLSNLRDTDPELFRCFGHAMLTATLGAVLRWPETADKYEAVSAKLLADTRRDVAVAVGMSKFRMPDLPFGLRPAMAM